MNNLKVTFYYHLITFHLIEHIVLYTTKIYYNCQPTLLPQETIFPFQLLKRIEELDHVATNTLH